METKQSKVPEMFLPEDSSFQAGCERVGMRSLIAVGLTSKDHRERNPPLTRERGLGRKLHRGQWSRTPTSSLRKEGIQRCGPGPNEVEKRVWA